MSYKAILVHVDDSPQSGPRVSLAAEIAKGFGATLIGLAAGQLQPVVDPSGLGGVYEIEAERERIDDGLKAAEKVFGTSIAAASVPGQWIAELAYPSPALLAEASAVDLIVVGHAAAGFTGNVFSSIDVGDVIMSSGRPVLVIPPNPKAAKFDRVIIAWKDTRESRRAVSDGLPFLKVAKQTTLVQVGDEDQDVQAGIRRVRAHLKCHGIDPEVKIVSPDGAAVEDRLMDVIASAQANLVIAGGYGHTRLREWIFGGVTRALIGQSPVPVLFSH